MSQFGRKTRPSQIDSFIRNGYSDQAIVLSDQRYNIWIFTIKYIRIISPTATLLVLDCQLQVFEQISTWLRPYGVKSKPYKHMTNGSTH